MGFSDKTLAEYIIHLAGQYKGNPKGFHKALADEGAEFPESFVENLLRMITTITSNSNSNNNNSNSNSGSVPTVARDQKDILYPGLARANSAPVPLPEDFKEDVINIVAGSDDTGKGKDKSDEKVRTRSPDRRDRRSRSRDRDRRSRSRDRYEKRRDDRRSRSRERDDRRYDDRRRDDRDRDRQRNRSSSRDRYNDRRDDKGHYGNGNRNQSSEPELYGIYSGKITNIMDFGAFVELQGFVKKEGLVHIGQIQQGMVRDPKQVVKRGQHVKVKVISMTGTKLSLSMKEVDQNTGADLVPERSKEGMNKLKSDLSNPIRTLDSLSNPMNLGLDIRLIREKEAEDPYSSSRRKRLSSPELWEAAQLAHAGVLKISELPNFDQEHGRGVLADTETEEDVEIELNEEEPQFLKGQTKASKELSPIRIVKNPDGSMQRAALHQATLFQERKELKQAQANSLMDSIPKDLSKPWEDPMAEQGERYLAHELRSINVLGSLEMPEWKQKTRVKGLSYGQISNKSITEQRENLPVFSYKSVLCQAIASNQVLVVVGETGSGKTTQMTQYMAEMGYANKGMMIGCTQPRRIAAMSIAKRVAEEYGCQLGQEVGYTVRFEDCTSPATKIKYMTDGMLMREYLADNNLSRYVAIMIDEAHERTINTDVLFGLLKNLLKQRQDFKLIVTSATLDQEKFSKYFFDCPIVPIPGRTHKVTKLHAKDPEADYLEAALITIMQIHLSEPAGDILVFLTGQEEIDTCAEILFGRMKALGELAPELIILPVYGSLPSEMQSKIFEPAPPGTRKCVIATNIAEASLTIDGIYYVIDPGFCKQKVFNPKLGMDSLVVTPISQASANQRAGRAGRTGPGKCYRLYTEAAYATEMLPSSIPEIQRTNLGNVVLQLKAMGINDLLGFDFMDPPPVPTLIGAMESLYTLGALDEEGLLTRLGRKMAEFPLEPSLSKMLIISSELGCSEEVLTIVAMLSVENPFYRPKEKASQADSKKAKFFQPEGDHLTLLAVYQAWAASKFSNPWCFENFIQARSMKLAQDVRKQLVTIMDRYKVLLLILLTSIVINIFSLLLLDGYSVSWKESNSNQKMHCGRFLY